MNHQLKVQQSHETPDTPAWQYFGATFWCLAAAMLPYCLFLWATSTSGRVLVPLLVIPTAFAGGVALGAAILWSVLQRTASVATIKAPADPTRLHELEERLANLETINSFERRLAEEALLRGKGSPLQ